MRLPLTRARWTKNRRFRRKEIIHHPKRYTTVRIRVLCEVSCVPDGMSWIVTQHTKSSVCACVLWRPMPTSTFSNRWYRIVSYGVAYHLVVYHRLSFNHHYLLLPHGTWHATLNKGRILLHHTIHLPHTICMHGTPFQVIQSRPSFIRNIRRIHSKQQQQKKQQQQQHSK